MFPLGVKRFLHIQGFFSRHSVGNSPASMYVRRPWLLWLETGLGTPSERKDSACMMLTKNVWPEALVLQQVNRKGEPGGLNPCARESMARTGRFLREKLISEHGHFSSYEGRAT